MQISLQRHKKLQFDLLLEKKTVSSEPAATPHL